MQSYIIHHESRTRRRTLYLLIYHGRRRPKGHLFQVILHLRPPHASHLAWLSIFSIPPLTALIRRDLNLSAADVSRASIASFAGAIFSRLAMGPTCDLLGPRVASAALSLFTTLAILAMSSVQLVSSPEAFVAFRFFVGFSLANFVANQFLMSSMFSSNVVGLANGVAAGWANVGSGLAQLLMPLIYSVFTSLDVPSTTAWRLSFIVPASFQAVMAVLVLAFGQDKPSFDCKLQEKDVNSESKQSFPGVLFHGLTNYRGWILGLVYGFCFGVEPTTDNIIAQYFYDRFNVTIQVAGMIAASFGMANLVSRPTGGIISNELGRRFGKRGRLWGLWGVQMVAGLLCFSLGRVNSLWGSIVVMCGFSVFVQAAAGLTFRVVPFVSKRSLGVISGMTGSGGTVGAVITQLLLFSGSRLSKQQAFL